MASIRKPKKQKRCPITDQTCNANNNEPEENIHNQTVVEYETD